MLSHHAPAAKGTATPLFAQARTLFDEDGFLIDGTQWNEALAERIARREGLGPLGARHWQLLHHIRERHRVLGGLPGMRRVCRATGIPREEIYALFGGCLPVWRIAGLPNPGEEAKAYLS